MRNILHRHYFLGAPQRGHISWRSFLKHYREQMLACDFFTIDTIRLQTVYVLFFIELSSRRVYLAGRTAAPNASWVTQQARQLVWYLADRKSKVGFLIHDRDSKFSFAFDNVFVSEDIVHTPFHAPKANAVAEHWVRTVREECLDHLLILNQGLGQQTPIPSSRVFEGRIHCWDVLGGILHDYSREAA